MNERSIFLEALDREDPAQRSAFLDTACAGDATLRRRVECLLRSHDEAGGFLAKPGPERLAEELAAGPTDGETQCEPPIDAEESDNLDFLTPADKEGLLGRLGHYDVQEVIGRGGMGIVLRAFDEELHRVVAIKVMAAQLATNASARKRFRREAQAAAAVSHDHVVALHAVEEANGLPYLVMHYVSGVSLQERLDGGGPLELHEILRVGMQTASGLAAAHAQGLIHRDVKPANILLENGVERVKITDFGLARAATDASLTQSGVVAGTPQYMSPEQARGEAVDQRTDLFSLGSVLYAMCTGRAPFRASGSMAVLKRVCEETPTPIRETNSEIPDWLVAIIDKLHAKDPAERFQSAAEVAELLGQYLAHIQHPSVAPLPAAGPLPPDAKVDGDPARRHGWRRWAVAAAAVLLLMLGGLSLTEATGVTNFRATVIRIFTPDGVLVVETDDPAVKVTVEGDGGLVITGAGLEEIRLRPGSYRVQADREGKPVPLDKNLVEVARGGRAIVKVKMEAGPALGTAKAEKGAFVLMGGKGVEVRKFDTLAEAVQGASDGDTIEIRGNGPFISQVLHFGKRALTIRAGAGYRPIIKAEAVALDTPLLQTDAPLVLEGIELQACAAAAPTYLLGSQAPVYAANCRFIRKGMIGSILVQGSSTCTVRNCEFVVPGVALYWLPRRDGRLVMDNNLITSSGAIELLNHYPDLDNISAHLTRNTIRADGWFAFRIIRTPGPRTASDQDPKPIRLELTGNVFDAEATGWLTYHYPADLHPAKPLTAEGMQTLVLQQFAVREQMNLYSEATPFLGFRADPAKYPGTPDEPLPRFKTFADWQRVWKSQKSGSVQGTARFRGGNVLHKRLDAPEQVIPDDFRLRPDSAGYRAGKDKKVLGADVDLVGPGLAYERWKKTPEYQQWLKETGQLRAEVPKPEPKAFVVLTGKGVEVRKFDTLAEAVQGASNGDTVEIRGNGPFVTKPIVIDQQGLTIRAGEGFWPVIRADPEEQGDVLLHSQGSLTLEGLDLLWVRAKPSGTGRYLVVSNGPAARLHAVNCRFLMNCREEPHKMGCVGTRDSALCHLRNCQILVSGQGAFYPPFVIRGGPASALMVENCLVGQEVLLYLSHARPMKATLNHNTFLGERFMTIRHYNRVDEANVKPGSEPFVILASANILGGPLMFVQLQAFLKSEMAFGGKECERALKQAVGWRDDGNLYWSPEGSELLRLFLEKGGEPPRIRLPLTTPLANLSAWKDFWGMEKLDSRRGVVQFQGGDLVAKAKLDPEALTPAHFRLRPDSPGYRAGKGGKDLGADVDLVGPGPAYERWKKTPEYQQWLKETGQLRAEVTKPEPKAFVVLTGKGVEVRKFDTLVEAVHGASDGDTIEIRGNGPFVTHPVKVGNRACILRAADGFRPVVQLSPEGGQTHEPLLHSSGPLTVEGLEFQLLSQKVWKPGDQVPSIISAAGTSVDVANCRFRSNVHVRCIVTQTAVSRVRNCEFLCPGACSVYANCKTFILDNCLHVGRLALATGNPGSLGNAEYRLSRNTLVNTDAQALHVGYQSAAEPSKQNPPGEPLRFEALGNVFDVSSLFYFTHGPKPKRLEPREAGLLFPQIVAWKGGDNVYHVHDHFVAWDMVNQILPSLGPRNLADWKKFWSAAETGSSEGVVRFVGGDLLHKLAAAPDKLTPADFRLRPDSAGYRAGKDKKDLGADVDLVGPGKGYERWKKTPEYQQWLKETKQMK